MPTSTSRLSYNDCFELLDQALGDSHGIRFPTKTYGEARQWQVRLHSARTIDRQDNAREFDAEHPLFGRSQYDTLQIRVVRVNGKAEAWLCIEQRSEASLSSLKIERLSEVQDEPIEVEYQEIKTIENSPLKLLVSGNADRRD